MAVDFEIGRRRVGAGGTFVIGEVAQAHDGNLDLAHRFIDTIAEGGADAVKFQTHIAAAESTPAEQWRVKFSSQDATRYDYWKRMQFTEPQWAELARHTRERGLEFLSSPFSEDAVDLLHRVGVPAWKVASGEVGNTPLLEHMAAKGLPFLISTGMSPMAEIDAAVSIARDAKRPFAVLQCRSLYPCPSEETGLNVLSVFRERYGCPVGLSDHSGTIYAALAAVAQGADVLEVHVTMSRNDAGPDVTSSITPAELKQVVAGTRFIEQARAKAVDKDVVAAAEDVQQMRRLFTKSIVAREPLAAGTTLSRADLAFKKPGHGVPPSRVGDVVGRRLRRAVDKDTVVTLEDLE
jgi:N,N'-diacetyllegionaminate synthase